MQMSFITLNLKGDNKMNLAEKIAGLDENALVTVLVESQRTRVTQDLSAEDIKEKLPTEPLLREYLLAEVETNLIAQAAVTYYPVYLNNNLLDDDFIDGCINEIEVELELTNAASQFDKNRAQIKALFLDEDDLQTKAFDIADGYLSGLDIEDYEHLGEDFCAEDIFEQLMVYMIFYRVNPLSLGQLLEAQQKLLRGETL